MTQPDQTPLDVLMSLGPCEGSTDWAAQYTTKQDVYNNCPYGNWILWLFFRQAPNQAERIRLGVQLVPIISPWVISGNMPTLLAKTQELLTDLGSFLGGTMEAITLWQHAALLEKLNPVDASGPSATEYSIMKVVMNAAIACAMSDASQSAERATIMAHHMALVLVGLGQCPDLPAAKTQLATIVRTNMTYVQIA